MITNNINTINVLRQDQLETDESYIKVLPDGEELGVVSLSMLSKGSIYTSVMKNLEVTVRGDKSHLVDKWLNLSRFVSSDRVDNGNIQILDYGMIAVESFEYDEVKDQTTLNCFDSMLLANQPYNADLLDITFPNTVKNIVLSVAKALNLETSINTLPNLDYVVDVDYWASDVSYTFRDVLNHMAQLTTSTIAIRNNKLTMFQPEDTGLEIDGLNQVVFNGKFGKTNIMAISQQPQNDTYMSPKYATVEGHADFIPFNDRREMLFSNNPIMLGKGQEWADELLPRVKNLEYNLGEFKIYHMAIFEIGDIVTINGKKVLITEQDYKAQSIIVDLKSSEPLSYQEKYVVETDVQRQGQKTSLEVDKLNGTITALVEQLGGMEDIVTQLEISMGEIELMVKEINNGNLIPNLNGQDGYFGWSGNSDLVVSDELEVQEFMTAGLPSVIKDIEGSEVPQGWQFRNSGELLSPFGYVLPNNYKYSFRGKVGNFKPFEIKLYEYTSREIEPLVFSYEPSEMEKGRIDPDTGEIDPIFNYDNTITTKSKIPVSGNKLTFWIESINQIDIELYDKDGDYIQGGKITTFIPTKQEKTITLNPLAKFVRVTLQALSVDQFGSGFLKIYDYDKTQPKPIKVQKFDMVGNVQYQEFTTTLQEETRHVQLSFDVPTATLNDPMTLTEMMFNRGIPKAYYESVKDAIAYSKSVLDLTSEKISLSNEKIDKISGDIHNTMVNIDGFDGVVIKNSNGKGLTVLNNQGDKVIELNTNGDVISRNMIAENIFATGIINAVRGEIGNFEIEDGVLSYTSPEYEREYTQADLSSIKNIIMTEKTPTDYELYIYDVNDDGRINSTDYIIIQNYLKGDREKPKSPMIKSRVQLGTNDGKVISTVLYDGDKIGINTTIQADNIKTGTVELSGMSFEGKAVEADSNGWLRVV